MRIVFLGSPTEVIAPLQDLLILDRQGLHQLVGVVSQPARPSGRKQVLTDPPVAAWAKEQGLPIFQPQNINSAEALLQLAAWQPDVMITAAYGQILRDAILNLPKRAIINIHPSMLPAYRGATPVPQALLDGHSVTGVTILFTVRAVDAGAVITQKEFAIDQDERADALTARMFAEGGKLLADALHRLEDINFKGVEQDPVRVTHCRKIGKEDGCIDWRQDASTIMNRFRAYFPWPGSFCYYGDKRIVIQEMVVLTTQTSEHRLSPGEFLFVKAAKHLEVGTGSGKVGIRSLTPAGSKTVDAAGFWNGLKISEKGRFAI